MPAPSRKAVTGNSPGCRRRNRPQGAGSPQFRSLCTAAGSSTLAQQGQEPTLLAGTRFIRVRGLRGERLGDLQEPGASWRRRGGARGSRAEVRERRGEGMAGGGAAG